MRNCVSYTDSTFSLFHIHDKTFPIDMDVLMVTSQNKVQIMNRFENRNLQNVENF